jgi:uncharacterized protein YjeT (DUF2065 family)
MDTVTTIVLVQIIGVYMLVAGISGLLYPERMRAAMREFSKSRILPYFDGAFALVIGLLIVIFHTSWEGLPAIIVSVVGWLAVLEGLVMFLAPDDTMKGFLKTFERPSVIRGFLVVALVVGLYLTYVGFLN